MTTKQLLDELTAERYRPVPPRPARPVDGPSAYVVRRAALDAVDDLGCEVDE